tara:strand:- start:173 stop:1600 length:1428 start_codon:yes stop_codon:yes gene_type:complete
MKKIFFLLILNIFFQNFSFAEKYWSDEKIAPTNIDQAENFLMKKHLKITSGDNEERFKYTYIEGLWYSHFVGFVGVYREEYKSNKYKMILIKAPIGYGGSLFAKYSEDHSNYKREVLYKRNIELEGTIYATIEMRNDESVNTRHTINIRNSKYEEDGTFKWDINEETILQIKSNDFFSVYIPKDTGGFNYLNFARITPKIKKIVENIDNNKEITDFEIEARADSMFIYFDSHREDDFIKDKFVDINEYGDIAVGKIYRGIKFQQNNGIQSITCFNKGSQKGIPGLMYFTKNNNELENPIYKEIKRDCDVDKISYSTFRNYENRTNYYVISFITFVIAFLIFVKFRQRRELFLYNKNNKNKFSSYSELKAHNDKLIEKTTKKMELEERKKEKKEEARLEKEAKAEKDRIKVEEAKIKAEERRLEREEKRNLRSEYEEPEDDYSDALMDKVKRLKRLYKNGTLSKAEFEKAKNKLLK